MLTVPENEIPKHLTIRQSRRIECKLKWRFAVRPERPACRKIARLGGTFDFHRFSPFSSRVRNVYLRYIDFTDEDMKPLSFCSSLMFLDAGNTRITDVGASYLAKIHSLDYLFLWSTNVSDDLADTIGAMTWLKILDVSNTRISRSGFAALHERFPNCLISHSEFGRIFREFSGDAALNEYANSDTPRDAADSRLKGSSNDLSYHPAR
jgi:hypothetical protein